MMHGYQCVQYSCSLWFNHADITCDVCEQSWAVRHMCTQAWIDTYDAKINSVPSICTL